MKKKVAMLCALMLLVCTVFSTLAIAAEQPVDVPANGAPVDLSGMEVGDVVYVGDIAIKRVADDAEGPTPPVTRTTTDGFSVRSFGGSKSNTQWLSLNSTYKYWYMWINNTSSNTIAVTIGNDEATQSANYYTVSKGNYDIWSTNAWPAEELRVSFSNGSGMYGSATGMLCTTLNEALDHLH